MQGSLVAAFDFSREIASTRAIDIGPFGLHGEVENLPARAMKGWNWTGEEQCWRRKPEQYGAIHFHDDDLYDAGWASDFSFTVPADMTSGVYAAHLVLEGPDGEADDGTGEDYIPFFVRPPRGPAGRKGRPKLAFLAPTAAYMAYANHQEHLHAEPAEMVIGRLLVFQPTDLFWHEHAEYGASLYDLHSDGSGVCYSSRLRPILNMRPKYSSWVGGSGSGLWQFNADTHLTDWLEHEGFAFDVITDEDLHEEGLDALSAYRVVVTGTHPEYYSTAMWDGLKAWLDRGGRLVYVGANGWYWRIALHPTLPGVIEVRRAEDGIRTWEAQPGEYYHSFSGEYGGLWRRLGRPPNVMCGVGFTAQGFDVSSYYVRKEGSFDPRAAFIFEGVGPDERIGDFGLVGGGAAGLELDRVEPRPRLAAEHAAAGELGRRTRISWRWSTRSSPWCRRTSSAHSIRTCAPTSPSSRLRRAARCSRPARSPGAARSRTTATTTTSPASRATSSAASSIRRRSPAEGLRQSAARRG